MVHNLRTGYCVITYILFALRLSDKSMVILEKSPSPCNAPPDPGYSEMLTFAILVLTTSALLIHLLLENQCIPFQYDLQEGRILHGRRA